MKYTNFKRIKFSTVIKTLNTFIFSCIKFFELRNFTSKLNFLKFFKVIRNFTNKLNFLKFFKVIRNFTNKLNSLKFFKIKSSFKYNFNRLRKKINFKNYKYLPLYFIGASIVVGFIYISIPLFYKYDKEEIEQQICKVENIKCSIKGKINYSIYPTPRIKITNLIIKDLLDEEIFLKSELVALKIPFKYVLDSRGKIFSKIELKKFRINFDFKKYKTYKNIFTKQINYVPIIFLDGKIMLLNNKDYVATISNTKLSFKFEENEAKALLKGKFLNDDIYINLNTKLNNKDFSADVVFKMKNSKLLAKSEIFSLNESDLINGNVLIKKDKNKITTIFDYQDNELNINKSNLRNTLLDGSLSGKVNFLPFFNFDLDLSLNSINFTKLFNYFLILHKKNKNNLFNLNNKINGKLSLSSDKVYSSYNLVKSFESRLKFNNSDIFIDQFLLNLGKLGAADIIGKIDKDKKFTNLKFESNIFVDNEKKFLSKFGIFNKKEMPPNLFVSGNIDLNKMNASFYEIFVNQKLNNDDVNYIEKEFNDIMFEDGYDNLFVFPKFKEFVKTVTSEEN